MPDLRPAMRLLKNNPGLSYSPDNRYIPLETRIFIAGATHKPWRTATCMPCLLITKLARQHDTRSLIARLLTQDE